MGMGFLFAAMKMFQNWIVVMVEQFYKHTESPGLYAFSG